MESQRSTVKLSLSAKLQIHFFGFNRLLQIFRFNSRRRIFRFNPNPEIQSIQRMFRFHLLTNFRNSLPQQELSRRTSFLDIWASHCEAIWILQECYSPRVPKRRHLKIAKGNFFSFFFLLLPKKTALFHQVKSYIVNLDGSLNEC